MRHRPIQAASRERVPIALWGRSRIRTVLAALAASAVGLIPALMVASPAQAALTAVDYLTIPDAANYEGGNVIFKLAYTGTSAASFTISVADDSADGANNLNMTDGSTDYDNDSFNTSVTFAASSATNPSTATVVIATKNDTDAGDEAFTLTAEDADTNTKSATGTIYALTETVPTLSLSAPSSVSESAGSATVVASLSSILNHDVTIGMDASTTATHGTGTDAVSTGGVNRDFTALGADAAITIPAGQLSGSINVAINDDNLDEVGTQYFRVTPAAVPSTISSVPGYVDVGITDNDATPTVSIGDAQAVTEGTAASFPVKLSGLSERALTVGFTTVNGNDNATSRGATGGDGTTGDYTTTNSTVTIPALTQTVYKTVATRGTMGTDSVLEGTENFSATISTPGPTGALTLGTPVTATATINDGATPAAPAVDVTNTWAQTFDEGASGTSDKQIEVSVDLSSVSSRETPLTLDYKFTDDTATNGVDYKGAAGTLTIPTTASGTWTGNIPVSIIGDTVYEDPDEIFNIELSSPNSTLDTSGSPIVVTIHEGDDDVWPTWSVGNTSVTEGNTGTTTAKVPVTLSAPAAADTTFSIGLADGTATETGVNTGTTVGANDYDWPTSRTLTIPKGSTVGYIEVPINADAVYEQDETVVVTPTLTSSNIDSDPAVGTLHSAALTIANDDAKPSIAFNNLTGNEGGLLRVNGTINGLSQYEYKLGFTVAAGATDPATPGKDFDAPAALGTTTLIVPRGTTGALGAPFPSDIYLTPDTIDEAAETFTVTATETTPSPTGFTTSVGTYKITDDLADMPPATSVSDETIDEDEGSVDVHVTLTQVGDTTATEQKITIPYWTVDGSAKAGQDYASTKGTLSIDPGTTTATIKVPIINDKMKEGNENFWVKLGTPTSPAGATIAKNAGEVIINANDGGSGGETPGEPGGPAEPGAPTIDAPAKIVGAVAVPITGQAAAGATVELWGAPMGDDSDLKMITSTEADEDGNYSFSRWIGQGYRFATQANDLNSEEVNVTVQQNPVFVASSPSKGKLYLAVQGNPRGPAQTVIVQKWVNGAWVNAWRGTTGSNNLWKATVNAASKSSVSLRAFVAGYTPDGLLPGYTATHRVTIK